MAHLALDRALPLNWIDEVFQAHRQRQHPRELLFSSVVELMLLVTPGLRPSLHAAARKMAHSGCRCRWRRCMRRCCAPGRQP